jgi:hypothetical protein
MWLNRMMYGHFDVSNWAGSGLTAFGSERFESCRFRIVALEDELSIPIAEIHAAL